MTAHSLNDLTDFSQAVSAEAQNPLSVMIALTRRLISVITAENELIQNRHRYAEAKPLIEEKGRLAAAYAKEMESIRQKGGASALGSADQVKELKQETIRFRRVLDEHHSLLARARAITEGMFKAIGDEIARRNQPALGYTKGAAHAVSKTAMPTTLALNTLA